MLVSDRYGAQMGWPKTDHQVCLTHLIRDAQYAIDAGDIAFAPGLQKLLQRACKIGRRRPRLADATLQVYRSRINAELDALLHIIPTHAAGEKLKAEILLPTFVVRLPRQPRRPAHQSAPSGRCAPCVVFRQVTNCFRSEWAAHLYADIRSVIETARRRAIGVLDAIRASLNGYPPNGSTPPAILHAPA